MKNLKWSKVLVFFLLVGVIAGYNHCVPQGAGGKKSLQFHNTNASSSPTDSTSSDSPTRDPASNTVTSVEAFGATVHPITKMRCKQCHGSFQQPLHAVDDVTIAHNAVIDSFKVNFNNPSQSRLVLKLRDDNHNCWSDCNSNANEMLAAIEEWKAARETTPVMDPTNPTTNQEMVYMTDESQTIEQELEKDNANTGEDILLLADSASLKAPMEKVNEGDFNSIWVPGTGELLKMDDNNAGIAYFTFNNQMSNNYKFYALVNAPTGSDDSFWVKVNNGPYVEWHITNTNGFEWREVTNTSSKNPYSVFISKGNGQMLEVRQREDGTKLAKIVISSDPNVDFKAISDSAKSTLRFDLGKYFPGQSVSFEIDVQEYDNFSYKFSNPKIESSTALGIKNIKLLINGQFNPQHATYTLIDTQVPAGATVLSPRALIALKDRGNDMDRISFSFEVLEAK